jgi:hypothetical protein
MRIHPAFSSPFSPVPPQRLSAVAKATSSPATTFNQWFVNSPLRISRTTGSRIDRSKEFFGAAASSGHMPFRGLLWRLCELLSRIFLLHDFRLPVESVAVLVWNTHRILQEVRTMCTTHNQALLNSHQAFKRRYEWEIARHGQVSRYGYRLL